MHADILGLPNTLPSSVFPEDDSEQFRASVSIVTLVVEIGTNSRSERPKKLPTGWFNWFIPLFKTPDIDVLHQSSIDGFLFLRFLRILCVICIFGACITWPILFPLHILGGGGGKQLDSITFGNVKKTSWYFAHAILAWVFFGRLRSVEGEYLGTLTNA